MTTFNVAQPWGASFDILLQATNEDGTPRNLTGAGLYFLAKISLADADDDAVVVKSTEDGGIVIDPDQVSEETKGKATVRINPGDYDPEVIDPGSWTRLFHQTKLYEADDRDWPVLDGIWTVTPTVVRSGIVPEEA